jgi:hypothetical protein
MITARDTGRTIIRATSGLVSDAVVVVVTNAPAAVVLNAVRDTLTAVGQTIGFSAAVTNLNGRVIENPAVTWSSTNTAAATVVGSGETATVTSVGFGSTLIIASSGGKADTIQLAVINPTVLYVDNSVFSTVRTGTTSRPFAKIQDAVNAAGTNDTVYVKKGSGAYEETVGLSRRIFLIGDSSAFTRSSPNPSVLPLIAHDTGAAAITAYTNSSQVIRFFRITHSTDGAAIDARGPNIQIGHVYVNLGEPAASGSGIVVDNSTTGAAARVDSSSINKVRGYGVRFVGVTGGVVRKVVVTGVDSITGSTGAGVEISGGSGVTVDSVNVRLTGGAQVHVLNHSSAALSRLNLAGRHQLLYLSGSSGNTQVSSSKFDMQLRGDETFSTGSTDGRSGVRIDASNGVTLHDNVFVDANNGTMDGVRITGSQGAGVLTTSSFGVSLLRNQFTGGRYNINSTASSWLSEATKSTSAVRGVSADGDNDISMSADTITSSGSGCVVVTGAGSAVVVKGATFSVCANDTATTMKAAVRAAGTGTSLTVDSSTFSGPNTIAIDHDGGGTLSVTRNVITANGTRTLSTTGVNAVIGSASASTVTITSNRVRNYTDVAGLHVPSGASATLSSNHFSRNKVGVRVSATGSIVASDNDWFDNDSAGVAYAGATLATLENNFWGDDRGPKRSANVLATGDSALGSVTPTLFRTSPALPGSTTASELRVVRGQATALPTFPTATVRVVDVNGLPVSGVGVSFSCSSNCGSGGSAVRFSQSTGFSLSGSSVTTNTAGLAEVIVDMRNTTPRIVGISASATGLGTVVVSVTGQ